jgi:hypothetical protein
VSGSAKTRTSEGYARKPTPLRLEAVERLAAWVDASGLRHESATPLPRHQDAPRPRRTGFRAKPMTSRAVEKLIGRYLADPGFDLNVTVHSLCVTALHQKDVGATSPSGRSFSLHGASNAVLYQPVDPSRSRSHPGVLETRGFSTFDIRKTSVLRLSDPPGPLFYSVPTCERLLHPATPDTVSTWL